MCEALRNFSTATVGAYDELTSAVGKSVYLLHTATCEAVCATTRDIDARWNVAVHAVMCGAGHNPRLILLAKLWHIYVGVGFDLHALLAALLLTAALHYIELN